jgi:hypothetical protein
VPSEKKICNYLEGPLKKSKSRAAREEDQYFIEDKKKKKVANTHKKKAYRVLDFGKLFIHLTADWRSRFRSDPEFPS